MTGPEHYREAERLLTERVFVGRYGTEISTFEEIVAAAQVHATLALAAATAIDPDTQRAEWREAAGNPG